MSGGEEGKAPSKQEGGQQQELALVDGSESKPYEWRRQRGGGGLGSVFGESKPKDVGHGLASGAKSVVKGVVLGVSSLVAAPVIGYKQSGTTGLLKGAGLGVVGAVAYPVTGVAVGVKQVGQGIANSTQAHRQKNQGKEFDTKTGKWIIRPKLEEELVTATSEKNSLESVRHALLKTAMNKEKARTRPTGSVMDTEYYDLLGVPTDATENQIRKAYYKLAKECHPDKHGGDPAMKIKFQEIGEAYQVLCDPERRRQYDELGKAAADKMDFLDSSLLFAMLFGSEAMEPYIGKLRLASTAEEEGTDSVVDPSIKRELEDLDEVYQKAIQTFRVAALVLQLRERLNPYVEAQQAEDVESQQQRWLTSQGEIATSLCCESFGAELLDAVGFAYENYGKRYLDRKDQWYGTTVAKYQLKKRQLVAIRRVYTSATKIAKERKQQEKRLRKQKEESSGTGDENMSPEGEEYAIMEKSLEHVLKTMLNICIMDVIGTVEAVCRKVLSDPIADDQNLRTRAVALKQLGKIYQEAATAHLAENKPADPIEQMQEAYIKAARKIDEQRSPPATV